MNSTKRVTNIKSKNFEKWCLKYNKEKLLNEWDYTKNIKLPNEYTWCSGQKVLWKCEKNHSWKATIAHRVANNTGCPVCSNKIILKGFNDLKTLYPDIAKEWNYNKNGTLTPNEVSIGSEKKVWWICQNGHEWQATIYSRKRNGCAVCSQKRLWKGENDLATYCKKNPSKRYLIEEWDYKENIEMPSDVTAHCNKKIYWICKNGHKWVATVASRVRGNGCSKCNSMTSFPEQAIFFYIKQVFPNSINRYIFDKTELDIFIPNIMVGIEYDGFQYHKSKKNKEENKNKKCRDNGIKLLRIREGGLTVYDECICIVRDNPENDETLKKCILELCKILGKEIDVDINRDKNKILSQYKKYIENTLDEKLFLELLMDWNMKKNEGLELKNFSKGSHYKANWKCHICGYEWKAEIKSRVNGNGCNNCAKIKRIMAKSLKVLNIDTRYLLFFID